MGNRRKKERDAREEERKMRLLLCYFRFIYSPDFHVGAVDHLAIAVPHTDPGAETIDLALGLQLLHRLGTECEFPRSVNLDEW